MGAQHEKVESTKTSGEVLVNELLDDPEPIKSNLAQLNSQWNDTCKASETRQNRLDQALQVRQSLNMIKCLPSTIIQ